MSNEEFISINKVAEAKGLKSNRSLRLEINKPESKYIAREVKVNGGTSYEILYSSLEQEIQEKLSFNMAKNFFTGCVFFFDLFFLRLLVFLLLVRCVE